MPPELKNQQQANGQNSDAANQSQQHGADHAAGGDGSNSSNRPDGLADNFWDDDKGEVKLADLLKDHGELSTFKKTADERAAALPKSAEEYKLPESLVVDPELAKLIPEGQEVTLDDKDPLVAAARGIAHKAGLSNEAFGELVQLYVGNWLKAQANEEAQLNAASEESLKKLGANGKARQEAVLNALKAKFGDKAAGIRIYTGEQVEVYEALIEAAQKQGNVLNFDPKHRERQQKGISDEDYEKMSPRERLEYARSAKAGG